MGREIQLRNVATVLDVLEYPIGRDAAAAECSDVTLSLADGEASLGDLISETEVKSFQSPADIESELHNVLPRRAVGEPYQSEGDA